MTNHHHLDPGEAMYELGVDPKGKKRTGRRREGCYETYVSCYQVISS